MSEAIHTGTKHYPIPPALLEKARALPVYPSTTTLQYLQVDEDGAIGKVELPDHPCIRCAECDEMIMPDDFQTRLGHLFLHHGWRMNGKRYNSNNHLIEALTCINGYTEHDWDQPAGLPPTVCIRCDLLKPGQEASDR